MPFKYKNEDAQKSNNEDPPQQATKRVAILVGNSKYQDKQIPQLPGPVKDVKALAAVLGDPKRGKFEVQSLIDKGFLEVRRAIASAANECAEDDLLLVYYSGSGFQENERLYLPVHDTEMALAYATAVDSDFVLGALSRSKARQKVLILDCCHAGSFFHHNHGIPDGLAAIASCGANEMCGDTTEGGVFTQCLVNGLASNDADLDRDGRVMVDEAFQFVRMKLADPDTYANPQRWTWNLSEPVFLTIAALPVFISYSRTDSSFVEPLFDKIRDKDIPAWMDVEGVLGGDDWLQRIVTALKTSRFVVAILSEEGLDSKWVRRELEYADKNSIPILPVVIGDFAVPDWFELRFNELQRVEFDPDSPESEAALIERVCELYKQL